MENGKGVAWGVIAIVAHLMKIDESGLVKVTIKHRIA